MMPPCRRGQAMVLWVLPLLLLSLMVFMTLSISARARQRLELQSVADAAAYSNAVATARTFNTISLINRTAISHWVALLGIQANHTWATAVKSYHNQFAATVREMEALNVAAANAAWAADPTRCNAPYVRPDEGIPPSESTGWYERPELYEPSGVCDERTRQIRAASYNFWHSALAHYNAPGASLDNVRLGCAGIDDPTGTTCTISNPRLRDGWGELDRAVAQQSRDVRSAIADISEVGRHLHRELRDTLEEQRFTRRLVRMAQGTNPMEGTLGPFQIERGSPAGAPPPGWREVSRAMGTNPRALEPYAHAAEGTRGDIFMLGGAKTFNDPDYWQPKLQAKVRQIENILNTQFGAGRFRFELVRNLLVTYYHESEADPELGAGRLSSSHPLGWKTAAGNNWGKLRVTYNDPCSGPRTVTKTLNAMTYLHAGAPNLDQHLWYTHGSEMRSHGTEEFPSCHLGHRHWGELNNSEHDLGPEVVNEGEPQGIYPGGFGFVFPQDGDEGARGAFGQPKVPTLLTRRTSGPDITPAPWDFTFRFRFNATSDGTEFDMRKSPVESEMMALSTGITYYHRRRDRYLPDESWRESPNLLNPFWHATWSPSTSTSMGDPLTARRAGGRGTRHGGCCRPLVRTRRPRPISGSRLGASRGSSDAKTRTHSAWPGHRGARPGARLCVAPHRGLYLTEASYLSLKVQEASVSALWDASGRRVHQFNVSQLNSPDALYEPLEDTWSGPLAAGPNSQARYEDFDGLAVTGPPRRLFAQASPMVVTCQETRTLPGRDPLSFDVPRVTRYTDGPDTVPPRVNALLRRWYQDRGGVRCNASAQIRPFEMPVNFMQREGRGFFEEPLHDGRTLRLCGVGLSVGRRCRGGYAVLLGDWSLDGPRGHYLNHDVPRRRPGGYNRSYEVMVERLFETSGRPYGAGRRGEPDHSSRFSGAVAGERPHDARNFYMTFAGVETVTEGFRYTDVLQGAPRMSSRLLGLTTSVMLLGSSLLGVGCTGDVGGSGPPGSPGQPGVPGAPGAPGPGTQGQPGPGNVTRTAGVELGTPMSSVVAITFRSDQGTGATTLSDLVKARVSQVTQNQLASDVAFPLPPAATDSVRTIRGLYSTVVVKWLDPLSFRNSETDASFDPLKVPRFGSNGDYIAFFGDGWDADGKAPQFSGSGTAGWMWSNNEYISLSGPNRPRPTAAPKGQFLTLAKYLRSYNLLTNVVTSNTWDEASLKTFTRYWKKQVGGSWFRVVQDPATGEWTVDRGVAARRFDATSDTLTKVVGQNLSGVDHADDGTLLPPGVVSGIHNDCSGGQTPWGTVITAEENVQNGYGDLETAWSSANNLLFPTGSANPYAAGANVSPVVTPSLTAEFSPTTTVDPDTDTYRHNRDMHGYVVEIDPTVPPSEYYGKTTPGVGHRKIGGMGRARWENASFATGPDWKLLPGEPIVFYSGDDRRSGRVYKFVSNQPYQTGMTRAQIRQLLASGKVYAAHFVDLDNATGMELRIKNPDGTDTVRTPTASQPGQGRWIELSVDNTTDMAPNAGQPTATMGTDGNPVRLPDITVGQALRDVSYNGIGGFPNDDEVRRALFTVSNKLGVMELNRPEDVEYNPKDPSGTPTLYISFTEHATTTALDRNGVLATAQPDLANPGRWMPRSRVAADLANRTAETTGGIFGLREADPAHPGSSRTFTYFRAWKGSAKGEPGYDPLYGASNPDNLAIDREGGVWFGTDGSFDASAVADGIYYLDLDPNHTAGKVPNPTYGKAFRILGVPSDAEATGPAFTPDMKTLFFNAQHPGEFTYSAWP